MGAHLENGKNIWMIQGCRRHRLLLEASQALGIGQNEGWQNLHSDIASQSYVTSAVDLAHAPSPEQRLDFIFSETRSLLELRGTRRELQEARAPLLARR